MAARPTIKELREHCNNMAPKWETEEERKEVRMYFEHVDRDRYNSVSALISHCLLPIDVCNHLSLRTGRFSFALPATSSKLCLSPGMHHVLTQTSLSQQP